MGMGYAMLYNSIGSIDPYFRGVYYGNIVTSNLNNTYKWFL